MAVRASRLAHPRVVKNSTAYSGCRSWVPLTGSDVVDETGAVPAIADEPFARLVERVDGVMR
jgi:hypothetical protein